MLKTIGYFLLGISCLLFLSILAVPWLGFSKLQKAGITTGLIIAGEILFYLSLFILGRSFCHFSDSFRMAVHASPPIFKPNSDTSSPLFPNSLFFISYYFDETFFLKIQFVVA
jgi:hypothetical protein